MVNKRIKYEPLTGITDSLGSSDAFYQAASVLDHAVKFALQEKDIAALLALSELWMDLAKNLRGDLEEEFEKKKFFGFGNHDELEEPDGEPQE